jgi:hypothetical protein
MRVISLGWGVQSFGLAAMSALGELPPVDVAIHSDTTHERAETYAFAARWTPWLEERGVRVVTVRPVDSGVADRFGGVMIPAFTASSGRGGQIKRQCTRYWKIAPIRRWLQVHRGREPVEMWLGISVDEVARIKPSDVGYISHRWPFCEGAGRRRAGVVSWLVDRGLEVPPRSACVFCPFHSRGEWRGLAPADFAEAVLVDEAIRLSRPLYPLFLHRSLVPLRDVDLRSEGERGQMDLWDGECSGHCGL